RGRDRQFVAERHVQHLAALEAEVAAAERPDRRFRSARPKQDTVGFGLQRDRGPALGPGCGRQRGAKRCSPQGGHQIAPGEGEVGTCYGTCHPADADHFREYLSSRDRSQGGLASGHFFAANRWTHVISPPPAAPRPDWMLFTRAWRNW